MLRTMGPQSPNIPGVRPTFLDDSVRFWLTSCQRFHVLTKEADELLCELFQGARRTHVATGQVEITETPWHFRYVADSAGSMQFGELRDHVHKFLEGRNLYWSVYASASEETRRKMEQYPQPPLILRDAFSYGFPVVRNDRIDWVFDRKATYLVEIRR